MVKLRALVPDATVNYIKNPAMRYDTTDWNAQGATISRVLTRARFGVASLKVVTAGSALHEGAFFRVSSLSGVSEPITVSAYVRGTGKVRIRLDNNVLGGTEFYSEGVELTDERWTRIEMLGFSTGGNDLRLFVETDEDTAIARTFYVDGAQLERKSYATTYCDGDQEGCRWNGIYHNSTSQRGNDTRAGGKWIELSGPDREAEDLYMTVAGGLGMAPLTNNTQSFALAPGGFFSNRKVGMRLVVLTFHAKHKVEDGDEPVSLAHLHNLRQMLIDIVKPDKTGGDEDIWFEYDDGTVPLYFMARYDGGLEGDWDVRNQFVNSFPLRLLSTSPIMEEDSQEALELDFQTSLNGFLGCVMRKDGEWENMNYGFSNNVTAIVIGAKGELIAAGNFVDVNNHADAIDPIRTANGIAYWDGEKWNPYGSGMNVVTGTPDLAVGADGKVYVTGNFTSIGGVAANRIAFWDGTTWNPLGTGLSGGAASVHCLIIGNNGDLFVGGNFTSAGGVTVANIARWDGSSWHRVGQFGGVNNYVLCMAINPDSTTLYIGGQFTSENGGGQTLNRVASYDLASGMFSPLDNGFDGDVDALALSSAGILYAGGTFTQNGDADTDLKRVAYWNGTTWSALEDGMDAAVYSMAITENQNLLAQGLFTTAGNRSIEKLASWNGDTWVNYDFKYPANILPIYKNAISYNPSTGTLYLAGGSVANTPLASGINYISNTGSTDVFPVFYVKGAGFLRWIENQTTRKRLYLDMTIFDDEEVFLDIAKGTIEGRVRGNLLYMLLPGSDFRAFTLRPGENKIACFMVNDVNAQMSIQFQPRHWSVDATQRGEEA